MKTNQPKGYTLVPISPSEVLRRKLNVYQFSHHYALIAHRRRFKTLLEKEEHEVKSLLIGGTNFGVPMERLSEIPEGEIIHLICAQPKHLIIGIQRSKDFRGEETEHWTYTCNGKSNFRRYGSAKRVARRNKAKHGVRIGHAIN